MRKQAKHQSKHKHKQTWCLNQRCQGPQPWQAWADLALVCEVHCSSILVVFPQLWQWQWPWRWGWSVLLLSQPELWGQQHPRVEQEITLWNTQRHTHTMKAVKWTESAEKEEGKRKVFPINYDQKYLKNTTLTTTASDIQIEMVARKVSRRKATSR